MQRSTRWALGSLAYLALLGGSSGAAIVLTGHLTPGSFAAVMFVSTFVACGSALQLYRRGRSNAAALGGAGAFLAILAFFATPVAVDVAGGQSFAPSTLALVLLALPLVSGAIAAAGTLFLARGVRLYRARHGLARAPEPEP